jgi:hypothetical protein
MKMRKALVGFLALAVCLVFNCVTAHAQTLVMLNLGSGAVTFTTTVPNSTATASFSATGTATSSLPGGTYTYSLTGSPVTLTQTSPGNYTASSTPLTLTLTGTGVTTGMLTGTVDLLSFHQDLFSGTFNNMFDANVTVTSASGSLGEYSGNAGNLLVSLLLPKDTPIDNLVAPNNPEKIIGGTGFMLPSPEPTSMLLFGSGMLVFGNFLRRRLLA